MPALALIHEFSRSKILFSRLHHMHIEHISRYTEQLNLVFTMAVKPNSYCDVETLKFVTSVLELGRYTEISAIYRWYRYYRYRWAGRNASVRLFDILLHVSLLFTETNNNYVSKIVHFVMWYIVSSLQSLQAKPEVGFTHWRHRLRSLKVKMAEIPSTKTESATAL